MMGIQTKSIGMGIGSVLLGLLTVSSAQADDPIPILTQPLSQLVIHPETTAAAQVISLNDTGIAAQVDGTVEAVAVRVGDSVKTGAVLLRLVCKDFELERERLKAEREAQQAKLELASWQVKQTGMLADQRTVPQEKLKEKHAELAALKAELNAQHLKIKAAEQQISHCTIKAPFAGVVTKREASVGQYVNRGAALVHLLDLSRSEVSAQVTGHDLAGLRTAGALAFEHDGQRYPLALRAILPAIQSQSGTQEVRLDFSGKPARPGAAGRLVWQAQGAYIASDHLLKRGDTYGFFTVKAGTAYFEALPGADNGKPAAISLPLDTPVIVSGQYSLTEGAAVKAEAQRKTTEREGSAADLARPSPPPPSP